MNTKHLSATVTLASAFALAGVFRPALAAPATPLKVGQGGTTTLEKNASVDYTVSLPKGLYRIVWDAERVDGRESNIQGELELLKPNGVVLNSSLASFNAIAVASRVGTTYRAPKPFVARFRLRNEDAPLHVWFRVVSAQAARVPFGWGAKVTPARISSDNGVGGSLEPNQSAFHAITLPPGKWSISLGLQLPDGQNSNLQGSIDRLDAQGFMVKKDFVSLNKIDTQARDEGILTITKPTPILLRVNNDSGGKSYKYDVTIEKAS